MSKLKHQPCLEMIITTHFGNDVFQGKPRWHNGLDFSLPIGTPVYAVADGTVQGTNNETAGYGLYIVLDHKIFGSLSAHLLRFNCKVGQKVKAGDVIGFSGNTGLSSGPHLHFEIRNCEYSQFWKKDKAGTYIYPVDPTPWLNEIKKESEEVAEKVYNTLAEVPDWAKPTIAKLLTRSLKGTDGGLKLNETMLRTLVINDREGLYK